MMRRLVIGIAAFLVSCAGGPFFSDSIPGGCQQDADCGVGGLCDATRKKCVEAIAISVQSPAEGELTGGPQAVFTAKAVAPGGPTKVEIRVEQPAGTIKDTESVTTGSAQIYTVPMPLGAHGLVSGPALVYATVFWGKDSKLEATPVHITLDMDPPAISAFNSGGFWSTAPGAATNAAVSVQVADVGGGTVLVSSVQLKCGSHTYQGVPGAGSAFTFAVPVADLGVASGVTADVSCTVSAADKFNNVATPVSGMIHVDNTPPVLTNPVVNPTTLVGGGAAISLSIDVADTGGSGVAPSSVKVRTPIGGDIAGTQNSSTFSFTIHGTDAQGAGLQGPVTVTFIAADQAGNTAALDVTVNVDRKAPAVISVTVTPNPAANSGGYYTRQGGQNIPVTVVVDDGAGGSGATSATLTPAGGSPISPTTGPTGSGTAKTFTFLVPTTVQTPGSAADVPFTVSAGDAAGNTVSGAAGGVLKIDDQGPRVSNVVVNAPPASPPDAVVAGVAWFAQVGAGNIDIQADITDAGAGVDLASVKAVLFSSQTTVISTGPATVDGQGHYHLSVPRNTSVVSGGGEALVPFRVLASDKLGIGQQADGSAPNVSAGVFGIDGKNPSVSTPDAGTFYSSAVLGPTFNAIVTSTVTDTGAGVNDSSAALAATTHVYPAIANGSTYSWAVPLGDLGVANGTHAKVPLLASAQDNVHNAGSNDGGSILIDNEAPTFSNLGVPSSQFGGSATINVQADVVDPAGGSGLDNTSVKVQLVGAGSPLGVTPSQSGPTFQFALSAGTLQADGLQGPVQFNFIAKDKAANPGTSTPVQAVNIDRQPPTVTGFNVPAGTHGGFYADGEAISVGVTVDGGVNGSALNSVTLTFPDTTTETNSSPSGNNFTVTIPTTHHVQAGGSETPVPFTIIATDAVGNTTGQVPATTIPIDRKGPTITNITFVTTAEFTDSTNHVSWFKQSGVGTIDISADIVDSGSGLDTSAGAMKLVQQGGIGDGNTLNTGSVTGTGTFHFTVSRNVFGCTAIEKSENFVVQAKDLAGNTSTVTATNKLGIDGIAPGLTFSLGTQYPASDCDPTTAVNGNTPANTSLVCGHDGNHFLRNGDQGRNISFSANDSGSGVAANSGSCTITGPTTCTASMGAGTNPTVFTFPAAFAAATLASYDNTLGTATASATVTALDLVGNSATSNSTTINVTRVKWIRALGVTNIRVAPIATTQPQAQIILAGSNVTGDPIISIKPTGGVLWSAGTAGQGITNVTTNMAYDPDPTQHYLWLVKDANHTAAFHIANSSSDANFSCSIGGGGVILGAPAIALQGANERVLVADSAQKKIWALNNDGSNSCAPPYSAQVTGAPPVGPPTVTGTTVYFAYDNTGTSATDFGIASATIGTSSFTSIASTALSGLPYVTSYAAVAIADNLFFGDASGGTGNKKYWGYGPGPTFTFLWGSAVITGTGTNVGAIPIVSRGAVYGVSAGGTTQKLFSYDKAAGTTNWIYPSGSLGPISPITAGGDGTLYFSDAGTSNQLNALIPAASSPDWNFKGAAATTDFTGPGSAPVIDPNGVLYFGADNGRVYALITDTNPTPPAASGADWPRVGRDNCNSNNATFTCP